MRQMVKHVKRKAINPRTSNIKKRKSNDPKPLQESLNEKELHCVVCLDLPEHHEIYQCTNSHLLCKTCHQRILESDNCVCPTCRVKLSRDNPCRSRLAEIICSKLVVNCSNSQCKAKLQHGELEKHEKEQCRYRMKRCKYHVLGCDWKGIAKDSRKHEKACPIIQENARMIRKRVIERNRAREFAERKRSLQVEGEKRLFSLLTHRCRNIVVRDILLNKDSVYRQVLMTSPTFRVFGLAFELILDINPKYKKANASTTNQSMSTASTSGTRSRRNRDILVFELGPDGNYNNVTCAVTSSNVRPNQNVRRSDVPVAVRDSDTTAIPTATTTATTTTTATSARTSAQSTSTTASTSSASQSNSSTTNPSSSVANQSLGSFSTASSVTPQPRSGHGPQPLATLSTQSTSSLAKTNDVKEESNDYIIVRLKCHSGLRRKVRTELCVLPGPRLGMKLRPVFFKHVYRNTSRNGANIPLSITKSQWDTLEPNDSINLRLIFCDKNDGLDRSFSTNQNSYANNSQSDYGSDLNRHSDTEDFTVTDENSYDSQFDESDEADLSSSETRNFDNDCRYGV